VCCFSCLNCFFKYFSNFLLLRLTFAFNVCLLLLLTTNYCGVYKSISVCTFVAAFNKLYCIVTRQHSESLNSCVFSRKDNRRRLANVDKVCWCYRRQWSSVKKNFWIRIETNIAGKNLIDFSCPNAYHSQIYRETSSTTSGVTLLTDRKTENRRK